MSDHLSVQLHGGHEGQWSWSVACEGEPPEPGQLEGAVENAGLAMHDSQPIVQVSGWIDKAYPGLFEGDVNISWQIGALEQREDAVFSVQLANLFRELHQFEPLVVAVFSQGEIWMFCLDMEVLLTMNVDLFEGVVDEYWKLRRKFRAKDHPKFVSYLERNEHILFTLEARLNYFRKFIEKGMRSIEDHSVAGDSEGIFFHRSEGLRDNYMRPSRSHLGEMQKKIT